MPTARLVTIICLMSCSPCYAKCDPIRALRDFCLNFVSAKSFVTFVSNNNEEEDEDAFFDPAVSSAHKMLRRSDLSDFSYYGERDEDYLPNGSGELIDDAGGESQDDASDSLMCFRGSCSKSISSIWGKFVHGSIEGQAVVTFRDRSRIIGVFKQSALHGISVEFDTNGRQRYIGKYRNGKRYGLTWYLDPRCGTAISGYLSPEGKFSGNDFLYMISSGGEKDDLTILNAKIDNGQIREASRAKIIGQQYLDGILKFQLEENFALDVAPLKLPPEVTDFKDIVLMQSTGIRLSMEEEEDPFQSIMKDPFSSADSSSQNEIMDESLQCEDILNVQAFPRGSLNQHAFVSPQGSGTKWILRLLELSTGIQDQNLQVTNNDNVEGLFLNTHHERMAASKKTNLLSPRQREPFAWRMLHLSNLGRRAVLLIRDPYESIVSSWTQRWYVAMANEDLSSNEDLEGSMRTQAFRDFAENELKIWKDVIFDWLAVSPRLLVIHYENFVEDPMRELERIHEFLLISTIDTAKKLRCLSERPIVRFRKLRSKASSSPTDSAIFAASFRREADEAIERIQEMLAKLGQAPIPIDKYQHTSIRAVTVDDNVINSARR